MCNCYLLLLLVLAMTLQVVTWMGGHQLLSGIDQLTCATNILKLHVFLGLNGFLVKSKLMKDRWCVQPWSELGTEAGDMLVNLVLY